MITKWKREDVRTSLEMVDIDSLVPNKHPLRKIEDAVDWESVYVAAEPFYSAGTGRPAIDPAVIVRIILLVRTQKKATVRTVLKQASDSISMRWFIGYCFAERLPSVSAVSSAIAERFDEASLVRILEGVFKDLYTAKAISATALGMPTKAKLRPRTAGYDERLNDACNAAAKKTVRAVMRELAPKKKQK
ncbi:MAG: transposase [Clostridia bacterium]|nr:transposase [Clostridia bacterium]